MRRGVLLVILGVLAGCGPSIGSECATYCGDNLVCSGGFVGAGVDACQKACEDQAAKDEAFKKQLECYSKAQTGGGPDCAGRAKCATQG